MEINDKYNCMMTACDSVDCSAVPTICTSGNCIKCSTHCSFFEAHFDCDGNIDYLNAGMPSDGYTTEKHTDKIESFMSDILKLAETEFSAVPGGVRTTDKSNEPNEEVIYFRCDGIGTGNAINFVRTTAPNKAVVAMHLFIEDTEDLLLEARSFMRKVVEHVVNCGLFTLHWADDEEV